MGRYVEFPSDRSGSSLLPADTVFCALAPDALLAANWAGHNVSLTYEPNFWQNAVDDGVVRAFACVSIAVHSVVVALCGALILRQSRRGLTAAAIASLLVANLSRLLNMALDPMGSSHVLPPAVERVLFLFYYCAYPSAIVMISLALADLCRIGRQQRWKRFSGLVFGVMLLVVLLYASRAVPTSFFTGPSPPSPVAVHGVVYTSTHSHRHDRHHSASPPSRSQCFCWWGVQSCSPSSCTPATECDKCCSSHCSRYHRDLLFLR